MPRSFLIKKNDKKTNNNNTKKNNFENVIIKEENTVIKRDVMPLTPLNRAVLQERDLYMHPWENISTTRDIGRDVSGYYNSYHIPGYYDKLMSPEKPTYPAISPYAINPLATEYYKDLLPPYSWYLHSLLTQPKLTLPPQPLKHIDSEEDNDDDEEDIHIDVEEVDDACSSTTSITLASSRTDNDNNMHSPIDFSNYHKSDESFNSSGSHQPLSPASYTSDESSSSKKSKGFQDGVTVGYTYEAFFVSDGRSRKKGLYTDTKQRYTCTICGKDYATSSNLSRHKQTHRNPDSDQAKKCPHCNKVYVSMPALSMHILTHSLKHQCNQCGKAFSRPWLLQGHLRSHTGEKPYGCAHCGKAFADRSNLRAHMQTHSTYKQFKCKRCNKSFALKSYLNKHYESACVRDDETEICYGDDLNESPGSTDAATLKEL